jgi:branched-chain amino acid transport system permease protein
MIGMVSGMMAAGIVPGGGLAVALIGGAVGSTAIGAVIERMVVAPLRGRDVLTTLIATLGVSVILQNGMAALVGPDPIPYPRLLPSQFYEIGPVLLTLRQMFCLGLCAVLLLLASFYVRGTHIGRATRAIAERPDVAAAFGVDVGRVCRITFWLASTMAGLAAVAVGTLYGSASAFVGLLYGLKAFICMLVAGNRYFEAVIAVAFALGILEALVTGYVSSSLRDAVAFFVLIGVLYLRPDGLFGSYTT